MVYERLLEDADLDGAGSSDVQSQAFSVAPLRGSHGLISGC